MMALPPDRIALFYIRTQCINENNLNWYRSMLSPGEIKKAERFREKQARILSLAARALARYLISEYTGLAPESLSFTTNDYGKPSLCRVSLSKGAKNLYFNLSHCKGAVVCGVCRNHEIGVDIEDLNRRVDLGVADRFFAPEEAAWVRGRPSDAERKDAFLDIWTLKEAYIKAKGRGLSIPLNSFSFREEDGSIKILFKDTLEKSWPWQFFRWCPEPGKKIAAAVCSPKPVDIQKQILTCEFASHTPAI